mgnify:CR=1 FL=1
MFRRRNQTTLSRIRRYVWPRGGWWRALRYLRHRVKRLPDPPHRIARGIFFGVFVCFTPLYGLHFVLAALLARLFRGNVFAALVATLFGNPVTFPLIAVVALRLGHFLTGTRPPADVEDSLKGTFSGAASNLWDNLLALFGPASADWSALADFWHGVFLPYLVGGIIPGLIASTICYYLTLPVVKAYRAHRAARFAKRRESAGTNLGARRHKEQA